MTSTELLGLLGGWQEIGVTQLLFGPGEVYLAATRAQEDILSETRILEGTAQLALVKNQEFYQFPPHAVTGVTKAAPAVLTLTAHKFNTDDEVEVFGVLKPASVNARWIVTKVDPNKISLNGSDTTTEDPYSSGGTVYHGINAAVEIREEGIKKLSDISGNLTGTLKKRLATTIERYRVDFTGTDPTTITSSPSIEVINFQEILTEPITIGVQGLPTAALLTDVTFYRRPLPSEAVSATVNPIIPSKYDELLELGTRVKMYSRRTEPVIHQGQILGRRRIPSVFSEAVQLFLGRKAGVRRSHARARFVMNSTIGGVEF